MKKYTIAIFLIVAGTALQLATALNYRLFHWINSMHTSWLDSLLNPFNSIGDGIILVLIGLFYWRGRGTRKFIAGLVVVLITTLLVHVLKQIVASPRPAAVFSDIHILGPILRSYSFPSGHAGSSFAILAFIGEDIKELKFLCLITATLVGLARIYSGVHFPGDVIFSAGMGMLIAFVGSIDLFKISKSKKE